MNPHIRTLALLALLLSRDARAAVPEPEPEPPAQPPAAAAAPADTSRFLPGWLHWHASFGIGWISSPIKIRQHYQGGQTFEGGLETRPHAALRLRLSGEYQVLPAVGEAHYQIVTYQDLEGNASLDTLALRWLDRGWLGAGRAEVHLLALPRTWLEAGVGRGYFEAGLEPYHLEAPNIRVNLEFPGSSGWAWIAMVGLRHEFELFGPRLGAEVRWSALDRPLDRLYTWSIRIGLRER